MEVVLLLVFLALFLAGVFLVAFFWALRSGQYDDTSTPAQRILFDETEDN